MRTPIALSLLAALLVACMSCSSVLGNKDPHEPGVAVGVYQLTADVDPLSTCADVAAAAPRPWKFQVELRRDKTVGYWMSGSDPFQGTIDDAGTLSFHASTRTPVHDVEKAKEIGACAIDRADDFTGKLAGAVAAAGGNASFTGTLSYSYAVTANADCRDVVGAKSVDVPTPLFAVLPCTVRFNVKATRVGDGAK